MRRHNIVADRWLEMRKIAFCFHLTDYNSNIRFNRLLVNVKRAFIISVACYPTLQPAMSIHRLVGWLVTWLVSWSHNQSDL